MNYVIFIPVLAFYLAAMLGVGRFWYLKNEWTDYTDKYERVNWSMLVGFGWPLILAFGLAVAPFVGLYAGIYSIIGYPTKKEKELKHQHKLAKLERECGIPVSQLAEMTYHEYRDGSYPRY